MRLSILSCLCLFVLMGISCSKSDFKKEESKEEYKEEIAVCEWDGSLVADTDIWELFVVEELVVNEDCGCYTDGMLKYVKKDENGDLFQTAYLIKYETKDCENYAFLITCEDGDCEGKKSKVCKFEYACNEE